MLRKFTKKRVIAVLSIVAALALAAGAYAFFTSAGTGTGHATVGNATGFNVTVATATGGTLLPGSGTATLAYTVKNVSTSTQTLESTAATVAQDGTGNILSHNDAVPGCKTSWFTATDKHPVYGPLAGSAAIDGSVDVTMSNGDGSGSNQDACQGTSPDITVTAN
jgi:hypothetical protein